MCSLVACSKGSTNDDLLVALMAGASKGFVAVGFPSVGSSLVLVSMKPNRDVDSSVQYMYTFAFSFSTTSFFALPKHLHADSPRESECRCCIWCK